MRESGSALWCSRLQIPPLSHTPRSPSLPPSLFPLSFPSLSLFSAHFPSLLSLHLFPLLHSSPCPLRDDAFAKKVEAMAEDIVKNFQKQMAEVMENLEQVGPAE